MMNAAEFRGWRKAHGLTQRQASKLLDRSVMTIRQYERGESYDDKPRVIPEHIERKCREYSEGKGGIPRPMTLDFYTVSRSERHAVIERLVAHGVMIDPDRSLWFDRDYFFSVWHQTICPWLTDNVPRAAYLLLHLGEDFDESADSSPKTLIQFFDRKAALRFFEAFRDVNDERTLHCNLRAFAQEIDERKTG